MIVSDSKRVVFVHVQKTGGLTVESLLESVIPDATRVRGLPGGRHARLGSLLRERPEVSDYFIFGFARNPWARMLSWYAMIERRQATAAEGDAHVAERMRTNRFWHQVATEYASFEDFVLRGPDQIKRLRIPQNRFLRARGRHADFVGRTENLQRDVAEAFGRAGLPDPGILEHKNAGPPRDYREHYSPAMRDRVAQVYAEDIERFGYTFD